MDLPSVLFAPLKHPHLLVAVFVIFSARLSFLLLHKTQIFHQQPSAQQQIQAGSHMCAYTSQNLILELEKRELSMTTNDKDLEL